MSDAVVGLVGVVVGAVLAGGATWLMAWRAERRRARAGVRLLQIELIGVDKQLGLARRIAEDQPKAEEGLRLDFLAGLPPQRVWEERRAQLAEVLPNRYWYPLLDIYECIDLLRVAGVRQQGRGGRPAPADKVTAKLVIDLAQAAQDAIAALSRLAGGKPTDRYAEGGISLSAVTMQLWGAMAEGERERAAAAPATPSPAPRGGGRR